MNKKELIKLIAKKAELKQCDTENVINALFDTITSELGKGNRVKLFGFGSFMVRERAEHKGRNPQNGEIITIPKSKYPAFKPSKVMTDAVKDE